MSTLHQRIIIIGCSGSGKSTLARRLAQATSLPLIHLDQLWWREGWQHIDREEFDILLRAELEKDQWIMDGNFDRTMEMRLEKCDAVIFLDLPRMVCILSVIKRVITSYGRTRPDMGAGCPERFDLSFLKFVWNFNRDKREKCLRRIAASGKTLYHIRSRRELPALIDTLSNS
jgi:adenylate kinase family enzyme